MDNVTAIPLGHSPTPIRWRCHSPCHSAGTVRCGVMIGTYRQAFRGKVDWTLQVGNDKASGSWVNVEDNAQVLAEINTRACSGDITLSIAVPQGHCAIWLGKSCGDESDATIGGDHVPCFAVYCCAGYDPLNVGIVLHSRYQCGGTLVPVQYANELARRGESVSLSWVTDEGDLRWLNVDPSVRIVPIAEMWDCQFDALICSLFYTAYAFRANPTVR